MAVVLSLGRYYSASRLLFPVGIIHPVVSVSTQTIIPCRDHPPSGQSVHTEMYY